MKKYNITINGKDIEETLTDEINLIRIESLNKETVAFAHLQFHSETTNDNDIVEIFILFVAPKFRFMGYANLLLNYVTQKYKKERIYSEIALHESKTFFEHQGFELSKGGRYWLNRKKFKAMPLLFSLKP